jgi:NADH-quinone oxidoreductase subunit M
VGEVLVLAGTFVKNRWWAAVAASGMILSAVYMLWMYQRVFLGKVTNSANEALTDIGWRERIVLIPVLVMMLWIGVYSAPFLKPMEASLAKVQDRIHHARPPEGGYQVLNPGTLPERQGTVHGR